LRWVPWRRPLASQKPRWGSEKLSSTVAQHEKRKQTLECQCWNHAEIDRRGGFRMVAQECPPSLRWRPPVPDHVFGDRRLGDLKPKLEQFTMDARGAHATMAPMGTRTNNVVMLTARVSLSCSWDWRLVLRHEILLGAWHAVTVSPAVDHW
jgi:hypothetical protein